MKPVSRRRQQRDRIYPQRRREVWERAEGVCEVRVAPDCGWQMTEVHHIAGRVGPDPHRLDNLLGCCAADHRLIHDNPAWARKWGYMASRHGEVSA